MEERNLELDDDGKIKLKKNGEDFLSDAAVPEKKALCEDILANHTAFLAAMAAVNGAQWGYLSRVKAAAAKEECLAAQREAHEYCLSSRRTLEV